MQSLLMTYIVVLFFAHNLNLGNSYVIFNSTRIVSREEWGARPALSVNPLQLPVPMVLIHHTSEPAACYTAEACKRAMRSMQDFHQLTNNWSDIGYNFAVGGDGAVYEGRGWDQVGAHATGVNIKSIGIVLIGHWVSERPPQYQLQLAQDLIAMGVRDGYIKPQYQLAGHRQVGATECPGDALYHEISTWDNFDHNLRV